MVVRAASTRTCFWSDGELGDGSGQLRRLTPIDSGHHVAEDAPDELAIRLSQFIADPTMN
jgi:hypothetical protein